MFCLAVDIEFYSSQYLSIITALMGRKVECLTFWIGISFFISFSISLMGRIGLVNNTFTWSIGWSPVYIPKSTPSYTRMWSFPSFLNVTFFMRSITVSFLLYFLFLFSFISSSGFAVLVPLMYEIALCKSNQMHFFFIWPFFL